MVMLIHQFEWMRQHYRRNTQTQKRRLLSFSSGFPVDRYHQLATVDKFTDHPACLLSFHSLIHDIL